MPIQYTYHSNSTIQPKETTTFGERCFINTNARLYDPLLGRFLQPDNLVQQPEVLSNYNRYTYVLNNPLKYKDPGGEVFVIDDILVTVGGFITGYVSYGIISGDWGGKAVVAGLGVGLFAEFSYATFGVGSIVAGSLETAGTFGVSFLPGFVITTYGARNQIKSASENGSWNGVLLTIGYGAVSSLAAGIGMNDYLSSSNGAGFLGKGVNEAKVLSNTIKGLNTILEKGYDTDMKKWDLSGEDWKDIGIEFAALGISSYIGEQAKDLYSSKIGKSVYEKNLIGSFARNVSYGIIQMSANKKIRSDPHLRDKLMKQVVLNSAVEGILEGADEIYGSYKSIKEASSIMGINTPRLTLQEYLFLLNILRR